MYFFAHLCHGKDGNNTPLKFLFRFFLPARNIQPRRFDRQRKNDEPAITQKGRETGQISARIQISDGSTHEEDTEREHPRNYLANFAQNNTHTHTHKH